jgi:hypothetical protein
VTEGEWLTCDDIRAMLEALRGKVSARKFRLFACACCRALFPLIPDQHSRQAVKTAERYADGEVSAEKLRFAWASARRSAGTRRRANRHAPATAEDYALWVVAVAVGEDSGLSVWVGESINWALVRARESGLSHELTIDEPALLRDLVGNPFRPCSPLPASVLSWADGTVPRIAEGVYAERAFDRLPILADALEDAGCAEEGLLRHCHGGGPHVRGCWAVDLLLGKE